MIKKLSNRLLGKDGRWHEQLIVGIIAGALPGYNENTEPWLYFLVPGWLFYVFLRIYGLLRVPRMDDLAFVLGVGYDIRRRTSEYFIMRKGAELGLLLIAGVASFCAVRYAMVGIKAFGSAAAQASVLGGELLLAGGALWGVFRLGLIAPMTHDGSFISRSEGGSSRIRVHRAKLYMSAARSVSSVFKGMNRTVLKRQVLYLLRNSIFNTLAVPLMGVVLAAAGAALLQGLSAPVMAFAVLIAPAFVLSMQIETMSESAAARHACTYNWFGPGELFKANIVISALMSTPYLVLYAVFLIYTKEEPTLLLCCRMLSFTLALAVICLVMGVRWSAPDWKGAPVNAALLAVPCVSFGIAVPYWGFLISLAAAGVIVWRRPRG